LGWKTTRNYQPRQTGQERHDHGKQQAYKKAKTNDDCLQATAQPQGQRSKTSRRKPPKTGQADNS
jgi:hypothetical protein